jgi:hypothetical protein
MWLSSSSFFSFLRRDLSSILTLMLSTPESCHAGYATAGSAQGYLVSALDAYFSSRRFPVEDAFPLFSTNMFFVII